MRYTPSGLPVLDCVLHHQSEVSEAGQLRMVEVEAPAVGFESIAHRLAACQARRDVPLHGIRREPQPQE